MNYEEHKEKMNEYLKTFFGNEKPKNLIRLKSIEPRGDDLGTSTLPPLDEEWLRDNYNKISPNGFIYNFCLNDYLREIVNRLRMENNSHHKVLVKKSK